MIETDKLHDALRKMGKKELKKPYRDRWTPERPTTGFCYIVAEVCYHYFAPQSEPHVIRMSDTETHWFLRNPDGKPIDLTKDQFDEDPPYEKGKRHAFRTKDISERAQRLALLLGLPRIKKKKATP
jgi:hypothetical protein